MTITIHPQVYRVGTNRPVTYAVRFDGVFVCYSQSTCGAQRAVREITRHRQLSWAAAAIVMVYLAGLAVVRHWGRWR